VRSSFVQNFEEGIKLRSIILKVYSPNYKTIGNEVSSRMKNLYHKPCNSHDYWIYCQYYEVPFLVSLCVLCFVRGREHDMGKLQFSIPKSLVELHALHAALLMLTLNLDPNVVHSANIKYKFNPNTFL
jgi:hypothetical protein